MSASAAPPSSSCARTVGPGTNLQAAIAGAAPGSTVCLTKGDYDTVALTNIHKSTTVFVRPANGAAASVSLNIQQSDHLRFAGLTVTGLMLAGDRDITFYRNAFTRPALVQTQLTRANILFDRNRFDGVNAGRTDYEGRIEVRGYNNTAPVGVTISNNHFGGGCSDGVQVTGSPNGVRIGPGNEFTGIKQFGCDPVHADPIQLYGAVATVVTGNWFHDNGDGMGGLASFAGDSPVTVTNNVFECTCVYPWSIGAFGARGWLVEHNTFVGGYLRFQNTDSGIPASGNVVRDNVWVGGGGISTASDTWGTSDHNLNSRQAGRGNRSGALRFVGGRSPLSYAGFRLATGSAGRGAASDGSDMGIRIAPGNRLGQSGR